MLALAGCITADKIHASGGCKVTSDCAAGLFCSAGVCNVGPSCGAASDCAAVQACVSGHCNPSGCDGDHPCNQGCCVNGACAAGDAPAACGKAGASCASCGGGGASCVKQVCSCTTCSGDTICAGSGCVNCASAPCNGSTPVCDAATHACQPCASNPAVCAGSTPFCNDDGSCSAHASSNADCARHDPLTPTLLSGGVCGCNGTSVCPNQLTCSGTACATTCTPNTQTSCVAGDYCDASGVQCVPKLAVGVACEVDLACAAGHCGCGDASCSRVCTAAPCATCNFATPSDLVCPSGATQSVSIAVQTPSCSAASDCGGSVACTCDGHGQCKRHDGEVCTADSNCASGHCNENGPNTTGVATGTCGVLCACGYTNAQGTTCLGPMNDGHVTPDCTGGYVCNGSFVCVGLQGAACSSTQGCESGSNCVCVDANCSQRQCLGSICTDTCNWDPQGSPPAPCNTTCCPLNAGVSCGPGKVCNGTSQTGCVPAVLAR